MLYDRRDFGLLRLAGAYQWLPLAPLRALSPLKQLFHEAELLASLGLLAFSRSGEYLTLTPEGYRLLSSFDLHYQPPSKRPYSQSPALRRRLEVGAILLTCLGAGIEPALDKVERLKRQPVFLPAFALRAGDGNLMNAAGCAGFGHWGGAAYMVQYVCEEHSGFFMNNELAHLHNLASVFSERLDTPQVILFAGDSYRAVYEVLTQKTRSDRNGKKGFVDYSQAYPQLGIPACLLSCDDTGALQLSIMRQASYHARIAQAAFGARWKAEDGRLPEADGQVDGNPLVIAVDMDLRRLDRVCRDARQQNRKEILVAALEGQMSGLLLDFFPKDACLGCNDVDTATYISKKCGMVTIKVENNQMPLMPLFSPVYTSTRPYSQTKSNTQRALMLPDEILRMDNRECLVLLRGEKPLRLYKIIPDEHPSFGRLRDVRVAEYIPHWRQEEAKPSAPVQPAAPPEENAPPEPAPEQSEPVPRHDLPAAEQAGRVAQYDYGLLDPEISGFDSPAQEPGQDAPYGALDLIETLPQDVGGERKEEGQL